MKTQHTGQCRGSMGQSFSDIMLIKNSDKECGIIDAKATTETYIISVKDKAVMITDYSKNYQEIVGSDCELNFVGYICGKMNINSDYATPLRKITNETNKPAFIMDAENILKISKIYDSNENKLFNFFELGGVLDLNSYHSL